MARQPSPNSSELATLRYRLSFTDSWKSKPERATSKMMRVLRRAQNYAVPESRDAIVQIAADDLGRTRGLSHAGYGQVDPGQDTILIV